MIEVYAEFSRTGGVYRPFPDAKSHRIRLDDLRDNAARERLRTIWLEPLSLDPSTRAAEVTRQVADTLAHLSRSLEEQRDETGARLGAERISGFLMRLIFTMFAEDVGLIPEQKFRRALESMQGHAEAFVPTVQEYFDSIEALHDALTQGLERYWAAPDKLKQLANFPWWRQAVE